MSDRIAFLSVSSYARHCFGRIHFGNEQVECTRAVSRKDAEKFNRYDRWPTYEVGMVTTRLASEDEVIEIAVSTWKERFPEALVLVRGSPSYSEPQFALAGPQTLINKLNVLYNEAKKVGWWDKDEDTMWKIHDEWYALIENFEARRG